MRGNIREKEGCYVTQLLITVTSGHLNTHSNPHAYIVYTHTLNTYTHTLSCHMHTGVVKCTVHIWKTDCPGLNYTINWQVTVIVWRITHFSGVTRVLRARPPWALHSIKFIDSINLKDRAWWLFIKTPWNSREIHSSYTIIMIQIISHRTPFEAFLQHSEKHAPQNDKIGYTMQFDNGTLAHTPIYYHRTHNWHRCDFSW